MKSDNETNHANPAVLRAVRILETLAEHPGSGIRNLTETLNVPRSTVYRILNALEAGGLVANDLDGYRLGAGLLRLTRTLSPETDLTDLARPAMDALAARTGATVKLSVIDGNVTMVTAVAVGAEAYGVTTSVGRRFPIHAGAASKLLLAYADSELRHGVLSGPLQRYTDETICDPQALETELRSIRQTGIATDSGEYVRGVHAIAVPVTDYQGRCVAALSIPFLETQDSLAIADLREGLKQAGGALSRKLGGAGNGLSTATTLRHI